MREELWKETQTELLIQSDTVFSYQISRSTALFLIVLRQAKTYLAFIEDEMNEDLVLFLTAVIQDWYRPPRHSSAHMLWI